MLYNPFLLVSFTVPGLESYFIEVAAVDWLLDVVGSLEMVSLKFGTILLDLCHGAF